MRLEDFSYSLPQELIAQYPLADRAQARLMRLDRTRQAIEDCCFAKLPEMLAPGDLLALNNTKVFPARLLGRRVGARAQKVSRRNPAARGFLSGEIELLLTREVEDGVWQGLAHPGRKIPVGEKLLFGDGELEAEVLGRGAYGERRIRLKARRGSVKEAIERLGHVPLPPYIRRPDEPGDREAYQTIYAKRPGSVAAPTAGLHFTEQVLDRLGERGIEITEITLHVGPGTFQPVRVAEIEKHVMEAERIEVSEGAAQALNRALEEKRRIIGVGTTVVRALEHLIREGQGRIKAGRTETRLFIYPEFQFRVIGGMLTNFHLPQSTLLMLVSAFAGREFVLRAYAHAVQQKYRFYSYGDCMLIL